MPHGLLFKYARERLVLLKQDWMAVGLCRGCVRWCVIHCRGANSANQRRDERRFVRRPHHRQKSFCHRPHHGQEGFCRITGKKAFAASQARRLLPHHRQEGFCSTTSKMVLLPHNGQAIFLPLQIRIFFLLTSNKGEEQQ